MQVRPCGHDWIYLSPVLFCCSSRTVCMQACPLQGKSLVTHAGQSSYTRAVHRLGMCPARHRSVDLQIFQFQLILTMVQMLRIQLGHCQQWWKMCCSQDSVYLVLLNHLSNHCTKHLEVFWWTKCQVALQVKLLTHNQNNSNEKKTSSSFVKYLLVYINTFFSVFFPSDRISGCVMLVLIAPAKKTPKKSRFWTHKYNALLPHFPHTDDSCHLHNSLNLKSEVFYP